MAKLLTRSVVLKDSEWIINTTSGIYLFGYMLMNKKDHSDTDLSIITKRKDTYDN